VLYVALGWFKNLSTLLILILAELSGCVSSSKLNRYQLTVKTSIYIFSTIFRLKKKPAKTSELPSSSRGWPGVPLENTFSNVWLYSSEAGSLFQTGMTLSLLTFKTLSLNHGFDSSQHFTWININDHECC